MRANHGLLEASETSLIIQSRIENLDPQQILLRDELIRIGGGEKGVTSELLTEYVRRFPPDEVSMWREVIGRAANPEEAVVQLAVMRASESARRLNDALLERVR